MKPMSPIETHLYHKLSLASTTQTMKQNDKKYEKSDTAIEYTMCFILTTGLSF